MTQRIAAEVMAGGKLTSDDVRAFRQELGMSQVEFADFVGVAQGTVASWEARKSGGPSRAACVLLEVLRRRSGPIIEARKALEAAIQFARLD